DLYGVRVIALEPAERRVRLRVFVVYYDTAYKDHAPLPDDSSFFLRALWERVDTRFGGGGPLGDVITVDEGLNESWADRNTRQFVERFERLTTRNHPMADGDYATLMDFYYERGGCWPGEDRLVQADYDVWVTEPRWLQSLTFGDSWGTTSYPTA